MEENGETAAGVNVGDPNGDGLLDLVLGKGRHWPLYNRVLLNDGKGGFTARNQGTAPDRTYPAALSDLDRDSDLDIDISNGAPARKLVYLNDGKGHFAEAGAFGKPTWSTHYVTLADLNSDGDHDIIAGNPGDGPHTPAPSFSCLNDRKGQFPSCDPPPTESATSVVAADFDGNVEMPGSVYLSTGQGRTFREVPWNDGKGTVYGLAFADSDGDGWPDIVAARSDAPNAIWFSTKPKSVRQVARIGNGKSFLCDVIRNARRFLVRGFFSLAPV